MDEDNLYEESVNLFPEEEAEADEETLLEDEEEVIGYKSSVYWDSKTGDLLLDGKGNIVEATPLETWVQWCEKAIETVRYQCLAYSDNHGVASDEALAASTREQAETILYTEIADCLAADPYGRTEYVQSIEFEWTAPDSVYVSCVVVGMDTTETIQTTIHL